MSDAQRYRFCGFELDAASGELIGPGGLRRRLEPQPARVLAILVGRAGQLVTREVLQQEVWPETHVDFDQGINYCIRQIRAALSESADTPRFIETLPRRGYRFLAPVEQAGGSGGAPSRGRSFPQRRRLLASLGLLLVVALVTWWALSQRGSPAPAGVEIRVAVLPFHGVDAPPSAWENRMTESLVVHLTEAGGSAVAVIGPATTAPAAREGLPEGELGRRLAVDVVLSGGVRSDGGTVFAQLLGAPGGEHRWATVLPKGEADAVGREIAAEVLAALRDEPTSDGSP